MRAKKETTRSRRADSATAAVEAAKNAAAPMLKPPADVRVPPAAMKFWPRIVASRPRDRWDELDLTNAGELCRMFADIERFRALIEKQGDILRDGKPHPAHKLLEAAGRRAVALSRVLQVHPEAKTGRAENQRGALALERDARVAMNRGDADDLIPGLRAH